MTKPTRNHKITPEELRELLDYNPDDGTFVWKERAQKSFNKRYAGKEALTANHNNGYKQGTINGGTYYVHRVAFAIYHGRWPSDQIDHINGHKTDNRIANLREVTVSENRKNLSRSSANKSGTTGVHWHNQSNRWRATIDVNGQKKQLGVFSDKREAVLARKAAEVEYGFHPNHDRQI
jgi:hypothetical protein